MKWSLRLGIHHDAWKCSIMVIIPKPNKPSYSVPGAYHPIQLLECLSKLLEKIVVKHLMFDCSHYHLIPPEQFRGVASALCIDAGLSLMHDIEYALNHNLQASLLTIDVKGFFDSFDPLLYGIPTSNYLLGLLFPLWERDNNPHWFFHFPFPPYSHQCPSGIPMLSHSISRIFSPYSPETCS